MLAGVLALAGAGSARAVTDDAAALTLEPLSGSPGTEVVVTGGGFDRCAPTVVRVNALNRQAVANTAQILWSGTEVATATVGSNGSIMSSFRVPGDAKPARYTVEAHCTDIPDVAYTEEFEVTRTLVPVPDLIGMHRDEAGEELIREGLVLGQVTGDGETVQRQKPGVGTTAEAGSAVDIHLGTLPRPTVVPNIVRLTRAQAIAALAAAELRLGRVSGRGDVVRSQDPKAGETVSRDSAVDITVGSATRLVVVPRVIRRTTEAAAEILRDRGLVLGPVDGDGERIRDQFPEPGTKVPVGSAVSVTTERDKVAPVLVQVPNVVGRTVNVARPALTGAGLVLGGQPAGDRTVASQKPAAGTFVKPRSVVTVTLVALPMVQVPDLVGHGADRARTALSDLGLVFDGGSASDRDIVSQQPAAGTLVPVGTTVTVTFDQPSSAWAAVVVLGALLLGVGAAIYRVVRLRLDQSFVRNKVKVVVRQTALRGPRITESNRSPAMPVVRIEPHADAGTHTLEEV
ncbi:beta-lactam-binding protein with PASTA domain [Kribbella antiqua]|uniref:Beta-lactam-binding protein with PASTA domain n=1 Tax=Kribbella antiqua TaxID=2512217 RepID=A0A4R2IXX2_9ACTN|nr:beta-lactam-binding protein with PASTA domain [Kribbella antiqua]